MSKIPFTDEQLAEIRANPYVEKATPSCVKYTVEFKKRAYEEIRSGKTIPEVFHDAGFNTETLGTYRMRGFRDKLLQKVKQGSGFADLRSGNYRRPPKTSEETVEQRVRQLENELAYTRQEVEFLKKLQAANMEAQKQWESKHRQK